MQSKLRRKRVPVISTAAAIAVVTALCAAHGTEGDPPKTMLGMPLLFADDFESGKAQQWEPTDASAWRVVKEEDGHVYNLHKLSAYETPVRSPFSRCLVQDVSVGDFVLEAKLQSTGEPDDNHRDLCLFFGFQDPAHMYYVHLGKKSDPHANSIFLVNNEPRVSIAASRNDGTPWDARWHRVRIVRRVRTGEISVYFDDMKHPAMTAVDKHFTIGRVGIGSFDNTGNFDDVRLWGTRVEVKRSQ